MKPLRFLPVLALILAAGCARRNRNWREAPGSTVDYSEDFGSSAGANKNQLDGGEAITTGEMVHVIWPFGKVKEGQDGELVTISAEDDKIKGPDGKPGVLRFTLEKLSKGADWFGFCFHGDAFGSGLSIPALTRPTVTKADADTVIIEFKYRAVIKDVAGRDGVVYDFRLEPDAEDAWGKRADLGKIEAGTRWKTFTAHLGDAKNLPAFLKAVNDGNDQFKLTWSSSGGAANYRSGDTLLLDDVTIGRLKK